MMRLYSALLYIVVSSPQPPPVCSIHLADFFQYNYFVYYIILFNYYFIT